MKTLQDYTTEELKAELKRRQKEERRERMKHANLNPEYAYATAIVKRIDIYLSCGYDYIVEFSKEDVRKYNIDSNHYRRTVKIDKEIKVSERPNVGDVVKLRSLKTKDNPTGFGSFMNPIICEVVKRNGRMT